MRRPLVRGQLRTGAAVLHPVGGDAVGSRLTLIQRGKGGSARLERPFEVLCQALAQMGATFRLQAEPLVAKRYEPRREHKKLPRGNFGGAPVFLGGNRR